MSQGALVKRQFGHRARLALSPAGVRAADDQAHAARTMWNLLHAVAAHAARAADATAPVDTGESVTS